MKNKKYFAKRISSLLAFLVIFFIALAGCGKERFKRQIYTLDDLEGKTIITLNREDYDKYINQRIPNVIIKRANSVSDLILNVYQEKTDALATGKYGFNQYSRSIEGLAVLEESIGTTSFGVLFADTDKSNMIREKFNKYLETIKSNGVQKELITKWLEGYNEENTIDFSGMNAKGETIELGVSSKEIPYSFYEDNQYKGYDVELMVRFCKEYGYNLKITEGDISGMIPELRAKSRDAAVAGYEINNLSEHDLYYSEPTVVDDVVLVVKNSNIKSIGTGSIAESLDRTFIEDNRYLEFISGILVTLQITFPSIILGTIIGFLMYFLKLTGNKAAKKIIGFLCLVTERIPSLVLLMIFYYVIFSAAISKAIIDAIATFSYLFSISIYNNICSQADSIPKGQDDAAYLLGFNKYESFIHIVFPQSIVGFLDCFKSDFVSLMLDTSIVSLIAISDLAGVGDRIRDMTLESFIPIISVSLIYFTISTIVIIIINNIQKHIDPKKRSVETILKGIDV